MKSHFPGLNQIQVGLQYGRIKEGIFILRKGL